MGDSLNPSVHSSMSDVSLDRGAGNKASMSSRSSKKREADRSASPFSDGSSNSGASNIPRPVRSNVGAVSRQPPQKSAAPEMKNPSTRRTVTRHLASSAAQVQKPAPLRESNRLPGTVLSKNGGPATGGHVSSSSRGNAVVLVQRPNLQSVSVESPPSSDSVVVETTKKGPPPSSLKGPPPLPSRFIEELKHSATGVEALGVLIQHLVFDLDAFSTPVLKKQVEEYKSEAINTKLSLDEAVASCKRYCEAAELSEVKHREHIEQLIKKHGDTLSEVEARLNSQVEETQCRYEEELKRRDRLNARDMDALLEDVKLYAERAERAEKRVEGAEKRAEHLDKEREDLVASENDLKQLCCRLQSEVAELQEKLRKDDVTRSGDCGKHRDEIQSLQAVLDLRTKELHDHRKKTEEYKLKTDALNSALARNAALQARVEDLEAQLQRKAANERKLQEEIRSLSETAERESRQSEQLALENEVLEWKINESSKLMASFSGQSDMSSSMTGSMMASSSPCSDRRSVSTIAISLGSPESPPDFMYRRYSPRLSPKSPYSDVMGTIELDEDDEAEEEEEEDDDDDEEEEEEEEEEIKVVEDEEDKLSIEPNLITPKVRTLVEKNESISWLVEMEEVIPAASFSSHVQNASLRRSHHGSPLNLLPQMMPKLPGPNSPSSSPPTSDPGSSLFRDIGGPHTSRKGAMPPAKKTRPERGKSGGMMYTSTPSHLTMHSHHRHVHHGHYHRHHQPRSTTRLPPSDSPLGSARSRSVSTDSESLDAEEVSAVANARIAELKAWRGGKSFASSVDRVPHVEGTSESSRQPLEGKDCESEESKKNEPIVKEGWGVNGDGEFAVKFLSDDDAREDCRTIGSFSAPLGDPSKRSNSPYCEFSDEFSNQSPFHGKFEVNGTSLNPMEDSSSSVELVLEASEKQPLLPSPSTKQPAFHLPVKQGITMQEPSSMLHQTHQLHFQPRHVLSSLCAHPHLSIKESAGEAMISEEISDDTQGESEEEDGKPSDSEDEDARADENGEAQHHEETDGATPSAEPSRPVVEREGNKEEPLEELASSNTLKLGQQLLSSSTPDSSHFAHTDSSVMDLSWSEDLELLPSESEV